jgi:hypothetical protein
VGGSGWATHVNLGAQLSHATASLTPRHRLEVARLHVEDGWIISAVAAYCPLSWRTVMRRILRYLACEPMVDRSNQQTQLHRPRRGRAEARVRLRSHRVRRPLARRVHRGPRRRERDHRGWRPAQSGGVVGRAWRDDRARPVGQWRRISLVPVKRLLGSPCHSSHADAPIPAAEDWHGGTLPPAMADGWAHARRYRSVQERRDAFRTWTHHHDQHRPHSPCGKRPPDTRSTGAPVQYTWR